MRPLAEKNCVASTDCGIRSRLFLLLGLAFGSGRTYFARVVNVIDTEWFLFFVLCITVHTPKRR